MKYSEELERVLRQSGLHPNRVYLDWEPVEGYTLFPAAQNILNEFSGLYIYSVGFGKRIKSSIDFRKGIDHPPMFKRYPDLGLYPLGETFSAHGSFVAAKNGDFFIYDHVGTSGLSFLASTLVRSFEILLLGEEWPDIFCTH